MNREVVQLFRRYVTTKLHFNEEAYTFKEGAGSKITAERVYKRKDTRFFQDFCNRIHDVEEQNQYLLSCMVRDPTFYIGDAFNDENKAFHRQRMRKINSLQRVFVSEVDNIVQFREEFNFSIRDLLLTRREKPLIITERSNIIGGVSDETLAIMNKGFKFCNQPETDDPSWNQKAFMLKKYQIFLDINKNCLVQCFDRLSAPIGQ